MKSRSSAVLLTTISNQPGTHYKRGLDAEALPHVYRVCVTPKLTKTNDKASAPRDRLAQRNELNAVHAETLDAPAVTGVSATGGSAIRCAFVSVR